MLCEQIYGVPKIQKELYKIILMFFLFQIKLMVGNAFIEELFNTILILSYEGGMGLGFGNVKEYRHIRFLSVRFPPL